MTEEKGTSGDLNALIPAHPEGVTLLGTVADALAVDEK